MTEQLVVTAITYMVAGMLPPIVATYLLRLTFVGGIWGSLVVGLVASFTGGLIDTFFLVNLPDLIPVAGAVDAGPPLILSLLATIVFALVSRSNG